MVQQTLYIMSKIILVFTFIALFTSATYTQDNQIASADRYPSKQEITTYAADERPMLALNSNAYDSGSSVWMQICPDRLFGHQSTSVRAKVYFSKDSHLDFHDDLLENFTFEKPQLDENGFLSLLFLLPNDITSGRYHLIVVAQTEEATLLQRTSSTSIWISGE